MRRPQMWHVVWLHGAMEWKETSLAQMKQISSPSSWSSSWSSALWAAVRGLAAAATAAAAGLPVTALAASWLESALALERLALRRWPPALERFPLPRPPPRPDLAEEGAPPLELPPRGPDEEAGGAGPVAPEGASIDGEKCTDIFIQDMEGSVVVRADRRGNRMCIRGEEAGCQE